MNMTYFKFFTPSEEATGMNERMIMAVYSYQCEMTKSRVAKKKDGKRRA